MKTLISLVLIWTSLAHARPTHTQEFTKDFIQVAPKRKLYTEYRQAKNGKPTLFLVNGLTYSTKQWQQFVAALDTIDPELGLVLYDMEGMGQTLLAEAPVTWVIPFEDQVTDLHTLKAKLGIEGASYVLGLSYGGAVVLRAAARFPDDFKAFIAMSPFLERIPDQDVLIKNSVTTHRLMFPFDPRSDQELYDYYLRILIYSTYPAAEPIVLENPYKLEAIFRMVQGAEDWSAVGQIRNFPADKVHVVAARNDEYVKFDRMQIFLNAAQGRLSSVAVFEDSHHKIPEERPKLGAEWVYQILLGNSELQKGLTFDVSPNTSTAKSGDVVIPLKQVSHCEALL